MHIDLFKCKVSESMGQRRLNTWPLYRFYIKYHLYLYQREEFSLSNPDNAFSFDFTSQYFSKLHSTCLCAFKHLWVGNLQDRLSKNTLQNGFVLECRKSPTFNLKQLQAEDIFSYSLSIAGELFHILENAHSLILIRLLLVEICYGKIKCAQDNSKIQCLLKLFH